MQEVSKKFFFLKKHVRHKYSEKQRVREAKTLIRFRISLNIHMDIHNHLITTKMLCHVIQIKISTGVERTGELFTLSSA